MPVRRKSRFVHLLRAAVRVRDASQVRDGQLLDCFVERRDPVAFETLLRRHGPMVFGVCRRVLGNVADAEDAFQAAFLVLVQKAATLRRKDQVGNWLYGVAYRTALEARRKNSRRRLQERQLAERFGGMAELDHGGHELRAMLDQELSRLPEKYRTAIVVCELEGHSRAEGAQMLKIPQGTLSSRLATGKKMLAKRLARYGLVPATAVDVLALQRDVCLAVPPALLSSTAMAAIASAGGQAGSAGVVSAQVAVLVKGVLRSMFLSKLLTTTGSCLLIGALSAGLFARGAWLADPGSAPEHAGAAGAQALPETAPQQSKAPPPLAGFENSPGWSWFEAPRPYEQWGNGLAKGDERTGEAFSAILEKDDHGTLKIYLAFAKSQSGLMYRPVAFDEDRRPYPLKQEAQVSPGTLNLIRYRLDPAALPKRGIAYLGIEKLSR